MAFCEKLRMLIEERDLTQKELAKQLKIPVSTLGGYVQGTSEPDFQTVKIIASFFHVSIDYLLDYTGGGNQSSRENDLLRIFRSLSPEQQDLYIEQGRAFIRINTRGSAKSSKSPTGSNKAV